MYCGQTFFFYRKGDYVVHPMISGDVVPINVPGVGWVMVGWCRWQGGHGTGKTGNLVITFSRQGKHREFSYNTGNFPNFPN